MPNLQGGLGGAASGAAAGSAFGPWGAGIGAGLGFVGGLFTGDGGQPNMTSQQNDLYNWYMEKARQPRPFRPSVAPLRPGMTAASQAITGRAMHGLSGDRATQGDWTMPADVAAVLASREAHTAAPPAGYFEPSAPVSAPAPDTSVRGVRGPYFVPPRTTTAADEVAMGVNPDKIQARYSGAEWDAVAPRAMQDLERMHAGGATVDELLSLFGPDLVQQFMNMRGLA